MTFSILVRDPDSGQFGGAAATGSLCVGGWVLRGDIRAGLSASQGAAPSVMWGEDVLAQMRDGYAAADAVATVVASDSGREERQLSALDYRGGTGVHTGRDNTGWKGAVRMENVIAAGNLLSGPQVLKALVNGFVGSRANCLARRLMDGMRAAESAGGDSRGLQSAALLVLAQDTAPLTLRVDYAEAPIDALAALLDRATTGEYAWWKSRVPSPNDPYRGLADDRTDP